MIDEGLRRAGRRVTTAGTWLAVALTAHTALNLRLLRRPHADPAPVAERVSVLLPARDEAHRIEPCLRALLGQTRVPDLEILVLDDGSTDGTGQLVRALTCHDPRVRVLDGTPLPSGWLGKPHACAQLAAAATGTVLVFVDADVVLAAHAVAATVQLLRSTGLELVSPYPRQVAGTVAERLVQPLLQWSWLTFLPLRLAERVGEPSLAAANGQLLAIDAAAYRRFGGHGSPRVRTTVLEDVELLRELKRVGGRGVVVDGTPLATCRMYGGWGELREGYTKSLWQSASPTGAAGIAGVLALAYVVPPAAALAGSPTGALGFAAGVAGRALSARRTDGRVWPDSLAHPVSVAVLVALTAQSHRARRAGSLTWKGRDVTQRDTAR